MYLGQLEYVLITSSTFPFTNLIDVIVHKTHARQCPGNPFAKIPIGGIISTCIHKTVIYIYNPAGIDEGNIFFIEFIPPSLCLLAAYHNTGVRIYIRLPGPNEKRECAVCLCANIIYVSIPIS